MRPPGVSTSPTVKPSAEFWPLWKSRAEIPVYRKFTWVRRCRKPRFPAYRKGSPPAHPLTVTISWLPLPTPPRAGETSAPPPAPSGSLTAPAARCWPMPVTPSMPESPCCPVCPPSILKRRMRQPPLKFICATPRLAWRSPCAIRFWRPSSHRPAPCISTMQAAKPCCWSALFPAR